jgi:hypothetical protein
VLTLWDDPAVQDERGRSGSGPSRARLRRWRRLLADEREAARVYRDLALRREGEEREILLGLAEAEERHAAYWERRLGDQVGPPGAPACGRAYWPSSHGGSVGCSFWR